MTTIDTSTDRTTNPRLLSWVAEIAELTQPDDVVWCDGTDDEYQRMCALLVEGGDPVLDWPRAIGVLGYLALVNSFAGLVLLGVLVRRGGASAGSAVFFLAPPVTALLAWLVLGETLSLREGLGLVVAVVGVAAATAGASGVPEEPAT